MLNLLYSSLVYLLEFPITYYFFYSVSEKRRHPVLSILLGLVVFESGAVINTYFNNTIWLNFIYLFLLLLVFSQCCFKINCSLSILYSVVLLIFCGVWEFATIFLVSVFSNSGTTDYNSDPRLLVIIVSISKLFYSLSCIVFVHFIKRRQITKRYPISFYLYPAIAFACLLTFWYVSANEPIRPISTTVFAVMSVLLFCSSMLLFVVYHHNLEKEGEYIKVKNEFDRLLDEKTHYDILEYQNQQLKIYAHDTRKHLAAISSLNSDPRITDYIDKLSEQLETYTKHCQSGNKTLDVIIDKYVTECELAGVQFYYDVRACNLTGVDAIDLVAILGNLLDNAVHAAKTSTEKSITFETLVRNSFHVIVLTNSCDTPPQSNGQHLISTKQDTEYHGLGLRSVKKTLKKYSGDLYWGYDNERHLFTTTVMLSPRVEVGGQQKRSLNRI